MTHTLEEWAKIYVDTINGPMNGWGQHVHPIHGRSDYIMRSMFSEFGQPPAMAAIKEAFSTTKHP